MRKLVPTGFQTPAAILTLPRGEGPVTALDYAQADLRACGGRVPVPMSRASLAQHLGAAYQHCLLERFTKTSLPFYKWGN